jgi:hypothetical protein
MSGIEAIARFVQRGRGILKAVAWHVKLIVPA